MSRRNIKPVDYASFDSPDFSDDDEDFIETKKTKADKPGKERAEKRRSADESSDAKKKKQKKAKTPSPKNEKQATNSKKHEAVIQLYDSDDSEGGKSETKFSEKKSPTKLISSTVAVLTPIQTELHTDYGAKESSAFVSATKVLDDDASRRCDSDGENGDTNKTPKANPSIKSPAEQKSSSVFKVVPQLSDRLKSLSKWTPPGPVGSSRSSDVMTTPNSGLRMGLSRNNRPKPLHPMPKLS